MADKAGGRRAGGGREEGGGGRGGLAGHPDPEKSGGPSLQKFFFRSLSDL